MPVKARPPRDLRAVIEETVLAPAMLLLAGAHGEPGDQQVIEAEPPASTATPQLISARS